MIKIYNPKGDSVGIIEPNMPVIEREMNLPPTLLFDVDFESSKLIQLEGLAKTEVGDYIVKEKKKNNMGYSVVCKPDFTSLQSELISYEFKTVTAEKMIGDILGANSGWTYNVSGSEKRSLKIDERNKYDSIFAVADTFRYEIFFDIESKKITMRNNIGDNSGKLYIHDEVNLINLVSTSDSYDVYTRIIPRGKDGLDIASINGGKTYIDNFQYSNKVKPLIWEDERYTVAENLKEDAIKKLLDLSKPHQSFEIDIINLYKLDNEKWEFLKFEVGDFVDLVSSSDGVDIKQRIVKKIGELDGDGTNDKIVIANLSRNFTDENSDDSKLLKEAMKLVEEVIIEASESLEADYNDKFKAIGDMIKGENGGYKVDRYNELGQAYETLYLDNVDINKAVNVIGINKSGITFSTNGIAGPFNTAMSIDGKIAGKYIIVDALETITANLGTVTAGRIQNSNGESYWDLNSGEMNLNASSLKIADEPVATVEQVNSKFTIMDGEISQKIVTEVTETINEIGIPEDGYTPIKGVDYFDGKDGQDGKDGKDGKSRFLHVRYSQDSNGSNPTTDPLNAVYIGIAVTETEGSPSASSYNWTKIKGEDGVQGEDGEDGETSYLHIKYSDDGITFTPNDGEVVGKYIGTYVDFVKKDSMTFSKYTWNKVRGEDGYTPVKGLDYFDGQDGQDGKDGTSKFLHIRYSQESNGSNPTTNPSNAKYIGVAVTDTNNPPSVSSYNWTKIKGEDGVQGERGNNGQTSYLHIKYSDDGTTFTANNGETVGRYIGTYVDFVKADSTTFSDYTWNRVRGNDGYTPVKGIDYFDGKDGRDGNDGKSKFLHIRYSQNSDGSNPTTDPVNAKYIGVAVTESNNAPSTSSYKWTLIKGTDGVRGEDGEDGETSYLHIKYSNDGGVTFTANGGEDVGDWIGTYVDFTKDDSTSVSKYIWNKVKGEKGADGYTPVKGTDYFDGKDGQDGISSYLWVRYSQNANGSGMTTDPTNAKYIGTATTTTGTVPAYTKFNWSLIKGTDGLRGEDGVDGKTSYLHIKYSDDGTTFTANSGETVGKYIGTYVDFTKEDSMTFSKYTWNKVRGEDGYTPVKGIDYFDGKDGKDGNDGKSKYLHIRYSQTESGSSPTTDPANAKYIGVAVTESNTPPATSLYKWTLIKGADGIAGEDGADGKTSYLHIKYSNNGTTFTANNGETVGDWIGTYVDFTKEDSTKFSDYTWNKIAGRSIEKVEVEYAQTTQPDSVAGASWSTTAPVWIKGRYIWSRTKTTYSTGNPSTSQAVMITGSEGADGNNGKDGADGSDGRGITSIRPQYYLSTSKTSQVNGSWSYTPPTMDTLKYMWTRNEVKWTNPTQTTWTPEVLSQELEEMKNVISRVTTVESRTTKDSIIGFVKEEKQSNGDPFFARTSEVKQTVDNWTAKFSSIGGKNLLYASNVPVSSSTYYITRWIMEEEWQPNTEYTVTIKGSLKGTGTRQWGVWASGVSTRVGTSSAFSSGETTFTFTTPSSFSISIPKTLQLYNYPSAGAGASTVEWIKLEKGPISTGYNQHPSELYTGITTIDKDGVTVGREGETIETGIAFDGLRIKDNTSEIASFTSSGSVIDNIQAKSISGDVMNVLQSVTTYTIGSGKDFPTISAALDSLNDGVKNIKFFDNNRSVTFDIYGTIQDDIVLYNFIGGYMVFNFQPNAVLIGSFYAVGCTTRILIHGSSNSQRAFIKRNQNNILFEAYGCTYIEAYYLNFDNGSKSNSRPFSLNNGTTAYIHDSDFGKCQYGILAYSGSSVFSKNNRGSLTSSGLFVNGALMTAVGTQPKGVSRAVLNEGHYLEHGNIVLTDSSFTAPLTSDKPFTNIFSPSSISTYSVAYGATSTHYGSTAAQNRWNTSMTFMKGRISFGSNVYSYIQDRKSGTTPTVQIKLRRKNSAHGASTSVAPTPEWSGAPSFGGATRGNWTPWVTIPYTLFTSSGYTFSFYNGSTGNSYAIWDRAEVKVTKVKNV